MKNFFVKLFKRKEKSLVLKDNDGQQACLISYNQQTNEVDIILNNPLNLVINGNVCISVNGDFDLSTFGDMRVDTFLSKLFINSYMSKLIKDRPESIEKRKEIEDHNKNFDEWMEVNREKMIAFAGQYLFPMVKDK